MSGHHALCVISSAQPPSFSIFAAARPPAVQGAAPRRRVKAFPPSPLGSCPSSASRLWIAPGGRSARGRPQLIDAVACHITPNLSGPAPRVLPLRGLVLRTLAQFVSHTSRNRSNAPSRVRPTFAGGFLPRHLQVGAACGRSAVSGRGASSCRCRRARAHRARVAAHSHRLLRSRTNRSSRTVQFSRRRVNCRDSFCEIESPRRDGRGDRSSSGWRLSTITQSG